MYRCLWPIENLSRIPLEDEVMGPSLQLAPSCFILISIKKSQEKIYVFLNNFSDITITVECDLTLCDNDMKMICNPIQKGIFVLYQRRPSNVLESRKKFDVLLDDRLIVDFSVTLKQKDDRKLAVPYTCSYRSCQEKLLADFKAISKDLLNTDISLKVENKILRAHRVVLCARSPYFRKLFEGQMEKRCEVAGYVMDVSHRTFKNLIHYLYAGVPEESTINSSLQEIYNLYCAAEKYEVMELRAICGRMFMSKCTVNNACRILVWANRHDDWNIKLKVMEFIAANFHAIVDTDSWQQFVGNEMKLAAEVIGVCTKKLKEKRRN